MSALLPVLEQIAREELRMDTLSRRHRDLLDFKNVAVWEVRSALDRAFAHGQQEVFQATPGVSHTAVPFDDHADQRLAIAREHLFFETLDTRRSDSLDFRDVAVWTVQDALTAAVEAGSACACQALAEEQKAAPRKVASRRPS